MTAGKIRALFALCSNTLKMSMEIKTYNNSQSTSERNICNILAQEISANLPEAENKIWHAHPVWFFEGNPIVG